MKNGRDASIIFLLPFLFAMISGCATIFHGSTGNVIIDSNPRDAEIAVDGKVRGRTPYEIDLAYKTPHKIEISLNGYSSETAVVNHSVGIGWIGLDLVAGVFTGALGVGIAGGGMIESSTPGQDAAVVGMGIMFGCIPLLVDIISGNWYGLDEDEISVSLEKK